LSVPIGARAIARHSRLRAGIARPRDPERTVHGRWSGAAL